MITALDLAGCFPAVITPMRTIGDSVVIDYPALERHITAVLDAGCPGVVLAGTTGQSAALDYHEHMELVARGADMVRRYAARKGRRALVIAGAGSNDTARAVGMTRDLARAAHVDAFLHVTGYYNQPPQEGLRRHFHRVADAAADFDKAVILYNVPSRTRSNIEAPTAAILSRHPAIIGLKEASGDLVQIKQIADATLRDKFALLSGEDDQVATIVKMGGTGTISASANRWPREFQRMVELGLAGRHAAAEELQAALLPCVRAVFCAKNPIPLHHMLGGELRLPLVAVRELDEPTRSKVLGVIEAAEAIDHFPHMGAGVEVEAPGVLVG